MTGERVVPTIIEPSFGISRILYALLEQSFYIRTDSDEQRGVLGFCPSVAPIQVCLLTLTQTEQQERICNSIGMLHEHTHARALFVAATTRTTTATTLIAIAA
jgi:glycyl-tRNA synthetase (class II)